VRGAKDDGSGAVFYNSIVNKTALSAPTNRFLGGDAPSAYLRRLQDRQKLGPAQIDGLLATHFIDPARLRADDLHGMMVARAEALAAEIADATGRPIGGAPLVQIFGGEMAGRSPRGHRSLRNRELASGRNGWANEIGRVKSKDRFASDRSSPL
jgi:hypothetical protein